LEVAASKGYPLYKLHIYTMGDKGYAGLMADILDPQQAVQGEGHQRGERRGCGC
jgi:TFIIF-interacting CTD phosphatase-like protein